MYSIIVCVDKNNAIGKGGKIPWKLKGEQLRFKKLTTNKTIVMGRKSFEEIGKPLLNRKNVIVSNSKNFVGDNLITINNLEEWLEKNKNSQEEIFICGGYNVYKTALNYVNKIYLTKKEKIYVLKKLKEMLILFENNGIIYDDIHLGNIYYDDVTKKIELIDIDNIAINNYPKDLNSFLIQDYCYRGGKDGVNARIYAFNLITYILLINNYEEYDIRKLYETFEYNIKIFNDKRIYNLCKNLVTGNINSNCDNEYLIDMIDEKILTK